MEALATTVIGSAIGAGAAIVFAAMGELLAEHTGVMNIGLEGVMGMGAVIGIIAVNGYHTNAYVALLAAIVVGLILGVIYSTATVLIRANQVLCGLGLSFLGTGLYRVMGSSFAGSPASDRFMPVKIPLLGDIPIIGPALFNQNILVYAAYLILPPLITYVLYRTRHGLSIRAVGENPAAADACGIAVQRLRFLYTSLGSGFGAAGGAYLTLAYTPAWTESVVAGRGWIAIALVIFGDWKPLFVILGAVLFGGVTSLGFVSQARGWPIRSSWLAMFPYLATILLMLLPRLFRPRTRQQKLSGAPAALGKGYYREEG